MLIRLRLLSLTALLLLCLSAPLTMAAPLTTEQLLNIEQVRTVDLSPDGKLAAYTVSRNRTLDEDAGGAWSNLYVVDLKEGTVRPFVTGEVSVGTVRFSPDGKYLSFTTSRGNDAKTQVWVMPVDGGEAQVATDSPTGVGGYDWSPDGTALYYIDTDAKTEREEELKEKAST